jgi:two-component system, OmpR family, sensor kinase
VPIRLRLAVVVMAAAAVAASVGGWVFVSTLSSRLHDSLVAELQARADTLSQQLQATLPPASASSGTSPDLSDSQSVTQVLNLEGAVVAASGVEPSVRLVQPAQLAAAHHGKTTSERRLPGATSTWLILAAPASDQKPYIVVVGSSLSTVESAVSQVERVVVIGGLFGVLVAGLAAWLLAGASLAPVERMRRQAAEISAHDTETRLVVPEARDEIAALATTLNELLARLQEALHHQRVFVAAAGHELRSPLAVLKTELELAGRPGRSVDELRTAVAGAAEETDRLVHLAEGLLLLAQGDDPEGFVRPTEIDLVALVGRIVDGHQARARSGGVDITVTGPPVLVAQVDALRLRQAIDNLLDNALRFAPEGSSVAVALEGGPDELTIAVADEGPGIDPDFMALAFDRFSRPDEARNLDAGGTGLGLSIVLAIVRAHGGEVQLANGPVSGAVVTIRLPRVQFTTALLHP